MADTPQKSGVKKLMPKRVRVNAGGIDLMLRPSEAKEIQGFLGKMSLWKFGRLANVLAIVHEHGVKKGIRETEEKLLGVISKPSIKRIANR